MAKSKKFKGPAIPTINPYKTYLQLAAACHLLAAKLHSCSSALTKIMQVYR
jgi:hypothetical protein